MDDVSSGYLLWWRLYAMPGAMNAIPGVLWLSLASALISFTVADAKIFASFRKLIKSKNDFLSGIVSCGYCLGHYVAFTLEIVYQPNLFNRIPVLDHILTAFVITWISGFLWIIMNALMKLAGK